MVNFRFHLVSLVAVFLALGIGILMGSTVIDQATVRQLERNIDAFRSQRDDARALAAQRRAELDLWGRFAEQARPELFAGRLTGVRVMVVAMEGAGSDIVDGVHDWLTQAGATDLGTLRLNRRFTLEGDNTVRDLRDATGLSGPSSAAVRSEALGALAAALVPPQVAPAEAPAPAAGPGPPSGGELLAALRRAGFVDYVPPRSGPLELATLPAPGTRLVVVGGGGALDTLAGVPLCRALARQQGAAVVAGEAHGAGRLVGALRRDADVADRVSTVDDLDRFYGMVALVLAVEDLASGTVGHYGLDGDRLVPAPNA